MSKDSAFCENQANSLGRLVSRVPLLYNNLMMYTNEERKRILQHWDEVRPLGNMLGMSQGDFCEFENLNYQTFRGWLHDVKHRKQKLNYMKSSFSNDQKREFVRQILTGEKKASVIAKETGKDPSIISGWKRIFGEEVKRMITTAKPKVEVVVPISIPTTTTTAGLDTNEVQAFIDELSKLDEKKVKYGRRYKESKIAKWQALDDIAAFALMVKKFEATPQKLPVDQPMSDTKPKVDKEMDYNDDPLYS